MITQPDKRLFIALNLPGDTKNELNSTIDGLRRQVNDVRWVNPEGLHITLHFLGDIDTAIEERVREAMANLENKFGAIEFELGRINAFPNPYRPRTIYTECRQRNGNTLSAMQKTLGYELTIRADIAPDGRRWAPHITLGRVRSGKNVRLPDDVPVPTCDFTITTYDLMKSELRPTGAEYTALARFRL